MSTVTTLDTVEAPAVAYFSAMKEKIAAALKTDFASSMDRADGVVVLDQNGSIVFMDSGFESIFECSAENTVSLKPFFGSRMTMGQHRALITEKSNRAKVVLTSGGKYESTYMGNRDPDTFGVRYVDCKTETGKDICVAIEPCPADIDGEMFWFGFVSLSQERAIAVKQAAEVETEKIGLKRADQAFAIYDNTGNRLAKLYHGLAYEVFKGVPGARIYAAAIVAVIGMGLASAVVWVGVLFARGDTTNNLFIDNAEPEQPATVDPGTQPER